MSDNFATKKSVWKETVKKNNDLFLLPGIIAMLGFGMLFDWLLTFTPFPILTMNDVNENVRDSVILQYLLHLLNGWIYTLVVMVIGRLLYIFVICPLKKTGSNYKILQTAPSRRGNTYSNQYRIIF